jgi:hypothetical protein
MQAEEDRMVIDQQVNESWATDIGAHHFDLMSEAHPNTTTSIYAKDEVAGAMASTDGTLLNKNLE